MSRQVSRHSLRLRQALLQHQSASLVGYPSAAPAIAQSLGMMMVESQKLQGDGANLSAAKGLAFGFAAAVLTAGWCQEAQAKQVEGDLPEVPTGSAASNTEEGGTHLVPLHKKQQLYFLYEKRIRDLSNSEKVFEYFANEKLPDGSAHMRPQDLLAALVPVYPPEGEQVTRSGSLPGEPTHGLANSAQKDVSNFFLKHFDIDDDGLISFHEYLLIITLLSVPLEDAETAFAMLDTDDSGAIDKVEFEALTSVLQARTRKAAGAGAGRTGFKSDPEVDESGLMVHFFGPEGDKKLDLTAFNKFLADLHAEIDRLEFRHYDPHDKGYMSGRDFAHSMIASVSMRTIHGLLQRVDELPKRLQEARITRANFETFTDLWRKVHQLHVATDLTYNSIGHFRRDDMKRASKKITGKPLSDDQVDIIYELFDVEKDGSLAVAEFIGVIKQREGRHIASTDSDLAAEMQSMGLLQCLRTCCGL
mmetsp:Transcript_14222/g.42959  ORF Transcript_14222/g.42959 Transcript_14222/m.42959 type:complete len:475 (-) Transcript_14222:1245-2669(-)|eukprot:CAMPEP_0206135422 /NCGR_PEP_ID=MMETSP1473-20131121/711_1 /ASSEMBLY_ACC=CAM_ASM_001109 /TAXON_ID=1461547 /ORGANISM="Stichococcus sp, Strain RCC1054" /LENGTH=474 /DNA_ID=CAMNT_0053527287 /DNA_START=168 /DNA_END=1592 /DNA_ORIENTATION=+